MDTTTLQPLQVDVPAVLEGHGGERKGVGAGAGQEQVEIIPRFILRVSMHRGGGTSPLLRRPADRLQGAFLGGLRRAVAAGGTQPGQPSVAVVEVAGGKGAEGVLAAGRHEVAEMQLLSGLFDESLHQFRQGDVAVGGKLRESAEQRYRLKMDAPDCRLMIEPKPAQLPEFGVIDTADDGCHQNNTDAEFREQFDSPHLLLAQAAAAYLLPVSIVKGIKLQKDRAESGLLEQSGKIRLCSQSQPVGVELDKAKACLPGGGYDPWQVVAHGRLSPRELQVAAAGCGKDLPKTCGERLDAGLAIDLAAVGKADRAVQVASLCDLDQYRTGPLLMARAEAAVIGAAVANVGLPVASGVGRLRPGPGREIGRSLPDRDGKSAVVGATLYHAHRLAAAFECRRNSVQAYGAEARSGMLSQVPGPPGGRNRFP